MFKVIWDNGEDTGNLGVFETETEAEEVDGEYARRLLGEELRWLDEMNRL